MTLGYFYPILLIDIYADIVDANYNHQNQLQNFHEKLRNLEIRKLGCEEVCFNTGGSIKAKNADLKGIKPSWAISTLKGVITIWRPG